MNVVLDVDGVSDTFTVTTGSGSGSLTTTYRSSGAGNNSFGANFTFSGVAFFAGKNIIAILSATSAPPSAVSFSGDACTKIAEVNSVVGSNKSISFWSVTKGAGGSGDIVVTASPVYAIGYVLWSTDAAATKVDEQELGYVYNANPALTPSISLPTGGSILIAAHSESGAAAPGPATGCTEVADFKNASNWSFWAGERGTTGQPGVTGFGGGAQVLAISLQP